MSWTRDPEHFCISSSRLNFCFRSTFLFSFPLFVATLCLDQLYLLMHDNVFQIWCQAAKKRIWNENLNQKNLTWFKLYFQRCTCVQLTSYIRNCRTLPTFKYKLRQWVATNILIDLDLFKHCIVNCTILSWKKVSIVSTYPPVQYTSWILLKGWLSFWNVK